MESAGSWHIQIYGTEIRGRIGDMRDSESQNTGEQLVKKTFDQNLSEEI